MSLDVDAEAEIPHGPYRMGREDGDIFAEEVDRPSRVVTLSAFAIDVYPVTNGRYRAFIEARRLTPDTCRPFPPTTTVSAMPTLEVIGDVSHLV